MRSLFVKLFLWFWLTMVIVAVALFLSNVMTSQSTPRSMLDVMQLGMNAQKSAEIFERHGQPALATYLQQIEQSSHTTAFLFNERGEELSGRVAAEQIKELAQQMIRGDACDECGSATLLAQQIVTLQGRSYLFVTQLPERPFTGSLSQQALRLLVAVLTGGALCYGLARYLTKPVFQLRATTHELSSGNLAARVGPKLIGRRDEIAQLGLAFNVMAERLESMVLAQRRLLGDISHELRSPLTRLGISLGLARREASAEVHVQLDRIEQEAEIINEMIGQLLTLTRLESGSEWLRKAEVDLLNLVRKVASDADFEARSLNRTVRIVESAACALPGIEHLLRSAIENVVRNAVHYTAPGTEVEISLRHVNGGDQYAEIRVRDHGHGVPTEKLNDIFRPFYRVEDARDRVTGGTGLGLAITERAVRFHGGTVRGVNAPDGGLIVEMRLPVTSPWSPPPHPTFVATTPHAI